MIRSLLSSSFGPLSAAEWAQGGIMINIRFSMGQVVVVPKQAALAMPLLTLPVKSGADHMRIRFGHQRVHG